MKNYRKILVKAGFFSGLLSLIAAICLPVGQLSGQTTFSRPDTTPNYSTYKFVDECIAAIERLKEYGIVQDPVWEDTVSLDTMKLHRPLPAYVVESAKVCLADVNVDTIPLKDVHTIASALLVANRDDDVERMYRRLADSIAADSSRENFMKMLQVYIQAVPVRLSKVIDLYHIGLANLSPDSVVSNLMLRTVVASVSTRSGDNRLANSIAMEIISITDTLSPAYKNNSTYHGYAEALIFPFVSSLMTPVAEDSLAVSSDAYRDYLNGVWKSIMGEDAPDENDPIGLVAPEPKGHFWYSNIDGEVRKISERPLLKKGKVNMIYFLQSGCHSRYYSVSVGRFNGRASTCWQEIHKTKEIQKAYPDINLVIVSNTFGTFGDAAPMEPEQEADTIAKYFLGFHGLKGSHIIYQTEFIRLAGYDGRKVDSETENHDIYRYNGRPMVGDNNVIMVDEEGKIFHVGRNTMSSEYAATVKLRTVMNRAANKAVSVVSGK